MPQMMPMLWILNLIYTTMMINIYILLTHYLTLYSPPHLNPSYFTTLKLNFTW